MNGVCLRGGLPLEPVEVELEAPEVLEGPEDEDMLLCSELVKGFIYPLGRVLLVGGVFLPVMFVLCLKGG